MSPRAGRGARVERRAPRARARARARETALPGVPAGALSGVAAVLVGVPGGYLVVRRQRARP
ncbi:hypothetical protein ABT288_30145 [Streptomyces sp. NPDC001093]|uniref:hypothetical protein n=1 Tax=Streptomyces sp. NPDC001093 TaxID=3154376 RepID=UPI003323BD29